MNAEWSVPCGFCAVPVLPQTSMPGMAARRHVPPVTAIRMPSATSSYQWAAMVGVRVGKASSGITVSLICFTTWGVTKWPRLAIVADRLAICSGVASISPCPIATEIIVLALQCPLE